MFLMILPQLMFYFLHLPEKKSSIFIHPQGTHSQRGDLRTYWAYRTNRLNKYILFWWVDRIFYPLVNYSLLWLYQRLLQRKLRSLLDYSSYHWHFLVSSVFLRLRVLKCLRAAHLIDNMIFWWLISLRFANRFVL
jgi:hypothetical protein